MTGNKVLLIEIFSKTLLKISKDLLFILKKASMTSMTSSLLLVLLIQLIS